VIFTTQQVLNIKEQITQFRLPFYQQLADTLRAVDIGLRVG
jgi:hypothetical protein